MKHMLTFQYCSKYIHRIVLKQPIKWIFLFFCCNPDHTWLQQSQDSLSTVLLQNEGLVMKLSTADGADCSWMVRGHEPWHPSLKDSNEYDESKQETCERTCGKAGEFLLEGQEKKKKHKSERFPGEEQRSSAALHSRWRKGLQMLANKMRGEKVCTASKARLSVWLFTSRCFRSSHKGGLVSPTDRPTINAMTASRINSANAMMMYFCQMKVTLVSKHILKHASIWCTHWCEIWWKLGGDPGEKEKRLPFEISSGISQLFWFLPLLC